MNPRVIVALIGAALVGLAAGFVVVNGWVPWPVMAALFVAGFAYATFRIREEVRVAVRATSGRLRRRRSPA